MRWSSKQEFSSQDIGYGYVAENFPGTTSQWLYLLWWCDDGADEDTQDGGCWAYYNYNNLISFKLTIKQGGGRSSWLDGYQEKVVK